MSHLDLNHDTELLSRSQKPLKMSFGLFLFCGLMPVKHLRVYFVLLSQSRAERRLTWNMADPLGASKNATLSTP